MAYECYTHAGKIPYADWRDRGIEHIIFDKDGTFTPANQLVLVDEVIEGMLEQGFSGIYPDLSVVSNNRNSGQVKAFDRLLGSALGVTVFSISRAEGYQPKPHREMGQLAASRREITLDRIGIVGDRRLTDVRFGLKLGVGAIALCDKVGAGDAKWVPTMRKVETVIVGLEQLRDSRANKMLRRAA